ncbi:MAG: DctP family TRAP transporter solute-binding subunit [Deltaproteobacteria bacterium]|nr:DctP family TRAP transporter solute-binding subunit [Deltaproteobacteria bacterium]
MGGKTRLALCAVLVGMLFVAGSASAAEKTIRLSHITSQDSPWNKGALKFAELVSKNTKGRIEVKVYPQSQLANGNQKAELEMLQSGVLDMTWDSPIILALFMDKRFDVFNLPWLYSSMDVANKVADGKMGELAVKWLEEKGIVGLGIGVNGFRELTNSKHPITQPDDMKGIKFRVAGSKLYLETFRLLGANAVTMNFGEVFTSLQQGVIDGQENPTAIIYSSKLYEVQKYLTLWHYSFDPLILCVNKKLFDSLSPDDQKAMRDAAKEAVAYERAVSAEEERALPEKLKALGMQVNSLTPAQFSAFKERVKPVYKTMEPSIGADNLKTMLAEVEKAEKALTGPAKKPAPKKPAPKKK